MKRIKKESIVPLVLAVSFNMLIYVGARIIAGDWHHYNIESPIDQWIPFWPPWLFVYLGCYLFWAVNYTIIAQQEEKSVSQFFSADLLSRIVCFFFYLAIPTTNIRPELAADGFWNKAMLFVYAIDAPDNLFPSIHCLVSWLSYIGLRGKENIPGWYRKLSCFFAILVCFSTLFTKQHVIIDVVGGILLAEICVWIGKKDFIWGMYYRFLEKINNKIFSKEKAGGVQ